MIVGVGTDLVEIGRIERACARASFAEKIYTEKERREATGNYRRLAGNFAVKEAVSKALGTGFLRMQPAEIEVLRNGLGKPVVTLYGNAKQRAEELHVIRIEVSISDTAELVSAFAVAEAEGKGL